jgi:polyvinyl alcohol dehydrogenase (cytochrome)
VTARRVICVLLAVLAATGATAAASGKTPHSRNIKIAAGTAVVPRPPACARRDAFYVHARRRPGFELRRLTVYVNRKRVRRVSGNALRHRIRVPAAHRRMRLAVAVRARRHGRPVVLRGHRWYRSCVPSPVRGTLPRCSAAGRARGDWPLYGRDLSGDRYQSRERSLTPSRAAGLRRAFVFATGAAGLSGTFESAPAEANGCIYIGSSTGWVVSLNAATGKVVWKRKLPVGAPGLLGTGVVNSPAVYRGAVLVNVSQASAPYTAALDQRTGRLLWKTVIDKREGAYNDASPVPYRGVVLSGFNGDESYDTARGGYTLLDARTGRVLRHVYTVPDADYRKGYNGGAVWATAAVDTATGHAYAGTGNPQGPNQHAHTNAILKIDVKRGRRSFGRIVQSYSGRPDAKFPIEALPSCQASQGQIIYAVSAACTHEDVDFGASPQLFRDASGRRVVGELQKAGIYHAVHTAAMKRAWTTKVGDPAVITNGDTAATDGKRIFVEGTPPGVMWALDAGTGSAVWQAPVGDQIHFQPVTLAAGVVYTVDSTGNLLAWDARDGTEVLRRPMRIDTGQPPPRQPNATSVGVSVARGTVFATWDEFVVAYRVP